MVHMNSFLDDILPDLEDCSATLQNGIKLKGTFTRELDYDCDHSCPEIQYHAQ